ncbi:hypothetical protein LB577_18350 [Mesorhizobium sp. B283B1A]|uniref:hypothetical protein n=1 Tax=Mesorhizobium TaxID=68287 RepID=UPI001CD0AD3C|nr:MULTISPECIES: hypothetical protein [Mesorhizobium]MCA0048886.1 hypothetical protein [Mesorhizobium sp. B283B1A]UQS65020.1 hypothetical protein M5D98_01160 [Mesorhizobium opportunistum]
MLEASMFAEHRVCQERFGGQAKELVGGKLMERAGGATVARRLQSIEDGFHLDLKTLTGAILRGRIAGRFQRLSGEPRAHPILG